MLLELTPEIATSGITGVNPKRKSAGDRFVMNYSVQERLAVAFRDWNAAFRRTDDVGFRLVRECPECIAAIPPDPTLVTLNPASGGPATGASR